MLIIPSCFILHCQWWHLCHHYQDPHWPWLLKGNCFSRIPVNPTLLKCSLFLQAKKSFLLFAGWLSWRSLGHGGWSKCWRWAILSWWETHSSFHAQKMLRHTVLQRVCCLGLNLCFQLESSLQCGRGVSGDNKGDTGSLCLLYALCSQGC